MPITLSLLHFPASPCHPNLSPFPLPGFPTPVTLTSLRPLCRRLPSAAKDGGRNLAQGVLPAMFAAVTRRSLLSSCSAYSRASVPGSAQDGPDMREAAGAPPSPEDIQAARRPPTCSCPGHVLRSCVGKGPGMSQEGSIQGNLVAPHISHRVY